MCAMHPVLKKPSVPPLRLPGRLVDNNSLSSHLAYMSPVQVSTKSSWICSICYALRHYRNPIALLVDCNIHHWVLQFLYSSATIEWNFPVWLQGIPLIYGVWQPCKHVCNIIWRRFFPLFAYITVSVS